MAFNFSTFKTRALTALIFVVVMLGGLFFNRWSFALLFILIHFGCWIEFVKILRKIYPAKWMQKTFYGLLYITMPVLMLLQLRLGFPGIRQGVFAEGAVIFPCVILFSMWINDTMAYLVGSFIGKTPFSSISPKKTWEGTIGGAILCIATIALLSRTIAIVSQVSVVHWMLIASICAVFGTGGDLLESKLKRMAGVKDSGTIMPGHGGFLDRFDSLLIATPFVWTYIQLFV